MSHENVEMVRRHCAGLVEGFGLDGFERGDFSALFEWLDPEIEMTGYSCSPVKEGVGEAVSRGIGSSGGEHGWSLPMTVLGGGRNFGSMNPIAFIETTAAVRSALLAATADPVIRPPGLHRRLLVATRRPRQRRA